MKLLDVLKRFFGSEGSNVKDFNEEDVNLSIEIKTDDDNYHKLSQVDIGWLICGRGYLMANYEDQRDEDDDKEYTC